MEQPQTAQDAQRNLSRFRIDGVTVSVPQREVWAMNPEWEVATRATLLSELGPGAVFVDVGAHVGAITCPAAAHVGPTGRVHAIEPSPASAHTLSSNVAANGLTNVAIHRCAVGAERGRQVLQLMTLSYLNGFAAQPGAQPCGSVEVEVRPLDELVAGRVDVLKVDVEGAELDALRGMRRIVGDNPDIVLCIEWNPVTLSAAGEDPVRMIDVLAELGLVPQYVIDESGGGRILRVEDVWASLVSGHDAMLWGNLIAHRAGRRAVPAPAPPDGA